jgi:predicted lipoprotein with Yx(FWY)xxD motif
MMILAGMVCGLAGCRGSTQKSANTAASERSMGAGGTSTAVAAPGRASTAAASPGSTSAAAAASGSTSAAAAGSSRTSATDPNGVEISSKKIAGLGTVLVNGSGHTLYVFEPDDHSKVTCTKNCAAVWPPVTLNSGQKPAAAGAAESSMLGSDPNPDGSGRVVTYDGWPLYTYAADTRAGKAKGQALKLNGGLWYVISPAGKVIKKKS